MNFLTEIRKNLNEITSMSIYRTSLIKQKLPVFSGNWPKFSTLIERHD